MTYLPFICVHIIDSLQFSYSLHKIRPLALPPDFSNSSLQDCVA